MMQEGTEKHAVTRAVQKMDLLNISAEPHRTLQNSDSDFHMPMHSCPST